MATIDDVYYLLIQYLNYGVAGTYHETGYSASPDVRTFVADGFQNTNNNASYIFDRVGLTPSGGIHQIYNQVNDIETQINDTSHGLAALRGLILTNLGAINSASDIETGHFNLVQESVENTEDQATQANTNIQTALAMLTGSIASSLVVSLLNASGGSVLVTIAQMLENVIKSPSLGLLHSGSPASITNGLRIPAATGVYGVNLSLTIPVTWGRKVGNPPQFIPEVGRYQWSNSGIYYGDAIPITANPLYLWPWPEAADGVTIWLATGITGFYSPLRLV